MERTVTVYTVKNQAGHGYWTTDKQMIEYEQEVTREEGEPAYGPLIYEEREVTLEELAVMEEKSAHTEFPGW